MDGSRYDTDVDLSNGNNSHTLMVELVGENASGKSTLLKCILRILPRRPGRTGIPGRL